MTYGAKITLIGSIIMFIAGVMCGSGITLIIIGSKMDCELIESKQI